MYYSVESILRSFIDIDDRNKRIILSIFDETCRLSCIFILGRDAFSFNKSPC
jgi:hypothetical protein